MPSELSGGMKKRVALARAIIFDDSRKATEPEVCCAPYCFGGGYFLFVLLCVLYYDFPIIWCKRFWWNHCQFGKILDLLHVIPMKALH